MDRQQLQYLDPYSLLIVNQQGLLKRLHCPFRVICKESLGIYPARTFLQVERVNLIPDDEIYYLIEAKVYPSSLFQIYDG
jgi:hypothetical protein